MTNGAYSHLESSTMSVWMPFQWLTAFVLRCLTTYLHVQCVNARLKYINCKSWNACECVAAVSYIRNRNVWAAEPKRCNHSQECARLVSFIFVGIDCCAVVCTEHPLNCRFDCESDDTLCRAHIKANTKGHHVTGAFCCDAMMLLSACICACVLYHSAVWQWQWRRLIVCLLFVVRWGDGVLYFRERIRSSTSLGGGIYWMARILHAPFANNAVKFTRSRTHTDTCEVISRLNRCFFHSVALFLFWDDGNSCGWCRRHRRRHRT